MIGNVTGIGLHLGLDLVKEPQQQKTGPGGSRDGNV